MGTAEAISTSLRGLLVEDTPSDVRYGPVTAAPGVMTSGDIHRASPNGIIFLYGMGCPKDLLAAASRRGVSIISCSSMDEILSLGMGELERRRSAKPLGGVLTGTAIVGKVFGAVKVVGLNLGQESSGIHSSERQDFGRFPRQSNS